MRTPISFFAAAVLLVAACSSGSGSHPATPTTVTTTTGAPPTTTSTQPPVPSSTTLAITTTTGCPPAGSTAAVVTTTKANAALLHSVAVSTTACADLVRFGFTSKAAAPPACNIAYGHGPFTENASGAPVTVAGSAFVVVRCDPAYGFDFETGSTTYTGPKRIAAAGARHVREVVETGDFEGVLTWVVGLDAARPFRVTTPGTTTRTLTIAFS